MTDTVIWSLFALLEVARIDETAMRVEVLVAVPARRHGSKCLTRRKDATFQSGNVATLPPTIPGSQPRTHNVGWALPTEA